MDKFKIISNSDYYVRNIGLQIKVPFDYLIVRTSMRTAGFWMFKHEEEYTSVINGSDSFNKAKRLLQTIEDDYKNYKESKNERI